MSANPYLDEAYLARHTRRAPPADMHVRRLGSLAVRQGEGEDEFEFTGYGLEWDTRAEIGWFTESFRRGAFAETLNDVRFKIGHDHSRLALARSPGTLKIVEDKRGLKFDGRFDLANPDARAAASAIRRGDVDKVSIGFSMRGDNDHEFTAGDEDNNVLPHYEIVRVDRLWEISIVDFPAHDSSAIKPRDAGPDLQPDLTNPPDIDKINELRRRLRRLRLRAT